MITTVDIGGTKTLVSQFNKQRQPVHEARFATPQDPQQFITLLIEHLKPLQKSSSAISVGVPGLVNTDGTVLRCGNLPWRNLQLGHILSKTYDCPVYIDNDANLAGLAEINALSPLPGLGLYLTVSTGIGSGVIVEGKLLAPLSNSEAGHMTIWDGEKWIIWEKLASGKALRAHFSQPVRHLTEPEQWQWVAKQLAVGLYSLIPALQPQVVVFGGSVGRYFDNYKQPLTEYLHTNLSSYIDMPKLAQAQHAEQAVLYGCYEYAIHRQAG